MKKYPARGMLAIPFIVSLSLLGCSPKTSDIIVLEIGPSKVSLAEYESFYTRNSGGLDAAQKSTPEERDRFLDLLANYKLKLQDAYDRGLRHDSEIVAELADYRASLATTFMLEKELTEPGIRQLYDRRREEIRAKHLLLRVSPDASPEETLKVYNRAMDLIRRLKAGESFDSLAIKYSEDPSVKSNAGDIYYFTGGQMVTQFENAVYAMKKGELSERPARTPFGYHIIKITDRQPVRGSIRVSHIMARFQSAAADSADTTSALARIRGALDSLKKGWDFHKLAQKISEDAGSASKGGDLGWFERRRFVQPFDEAAFKLAVGEISPVVRTPFGYHLIRCDSAQALRSFEKMKDDLKKAYQQHRYADDYNEYLAGIKKQYNYSFDDSTFGKFVSLLDSTKSTADSAWAGGVTPEIGSQRIMMIGGGAIPLDTVIGRLDRNPDFRGTPLRAGELRQRFDRIAETLLLETKSVGLEDRNPEFASLMKEYTDGVVLYKAEQMEVWNKTTVSDSALKEFYEQNRSMFKFPVRVNISVLIPGPDTLAYLVYDSLKHGADFVSMLPSYQEDPALKSKDGARGLQPVDTDELTKRAASLSVGEISEPIETENNTFAIVKLIAREPAREKTFEEAGAEVSNAYQDHLSKQLEQQWLDRIKARYPVKKYPEALKDAFASSGSSH